MVLNPVTNKLYVFGQGGINGSTIAVVDTAAKKVLSYLDAPIGTQFGIGMLVANTLSNKIYFLSTGNLSVIDGATDTITQTVNLTLPVAHSGVFEPNTNKFYFAANSGITIVDANTLTQTGSIVGMGPGTVPGGPAILVVNPANNKVYAFYDLITMTGLQVIDSNTDKVLQATTCGKGGCKPVIAGFPISAFLNPADNSLWVFSDATASTTVAGNQGAGPLANPPATNLTRMNSTTDAVVETHRVFGRFAGPFGVDPLSGQIVALGTYLPHVANPVPSATIGGPLTDTGADPQLASFDLKNPARLTDIAFNPNLLTVPPGSSFLCGTGNPATLAVIGVDVAQGNIFWRCDPTVSSGASVVISKTSYLPTPAALLPPEVFSQQVIQLPTSLKFPINPVTTSPSAYDALHRAFFLSSFSNSVVVVDPVASKVDTVNLGNAVAPPPPPAPTPTPSPTPPPPTPTPTPAPTATFRISGVVANASAGLPGVAILLSTGASAATDGSGNFSFANIAPGTYTVAIATPGVLSPTPSQTVTITNATAIVRFAALTAPINVLNVQWAGGATALGPGMLSPGSLQLDQAVPAGTVISLISSNPKALKVPATVTVPAGSNVINFTAQASGVSSAASATVTASYSGAFAPLGTSAASSAISVFPADTVHVTKATWSQSTHTLAIQATDTNPAAVLNVLSSANNQLIGNMSSLGNGSFTFQISLPANPVSVKLISNIGGNTGQGVAIVP